MITLIEAKNFRCLRYVRQPLGEFHVLVGPNASGKTTFLDVISFLGSLVENGLEKTILERSKNFVDLLFGRQGTDFELAIECKIPDDRRELLKENRFDTIRYEVAIGHEKVSGVFGIIAERLILKKADEGRVGNALRETFPVSKEPPSHIIHPMKVKNGRTVVSKNKPGFSMYYSEVLKKKGWGLSFNLGHQKSALGNLPEDESKFPVSTWFKEFLVNGVQQLVLNSMLIRQASPPMYIKGFRADGSNLPWIIENIRKKSPEAIAGWVSHLKTALPDIEDIKTVERPDDRHRYLVICYKGGLEVPSWMASDGTLCLLALTLPAYIPDLSGVYLIEEPENGIHPRAVETVFQSLSSVYDTQILLATHSPVILSMVDPAQVLCFAKTEDGATDIVLGRDHPNLQNWKGETNLGVFFAAGVLG
jgi:predicted ATPase